MRLRSVRTLTTSQSHNSNISLITQPTNNNNKNNADLTVIGALVTSATTTTCRSKLHDESRLIQRSFNDNKGDEKKLKG